MFQGLFLFSAITKMDDALKRTLYSGIISTVPGALYSECILLSSNEKLCPCNIFNIPFINEIIKVCMIR